MNYSEAFMGAGRKQTDAEELAECLRDINYMQAVADISGIVSINKKLLDLLAEASSNLQYARNLIGPDEVLDDFLTRIAPLVKQHRGE